MSAPWHFHRGRRPAAGPSGRPQTSARLVLLGVFINQFGAFLQAFLVLYLVHRGYSENEAGLALACYGAGAVAGLLLGGSLTDRIGPRLTLVLSMFSSAVLVVTVSQLSWYWLIVVVVLASGMMTQAYRPASATLLIGMTPPSRQVMTMAMNRIAMNVGAVGGPLSGGRLADHGGLEPDLLARRRHRGRATG